MRNAVADLYGERAGAQAKRTVDNHGCGDAESLRRRIRNSPDSSHVAERNDLDDRSSESARDPVNRRAPRSLSHSRAIYPAHRKRKIYRPGARRDLVNTAYALDL